jgi:hypothetical protein
MSASNKTKVLLYWYIFGVPICLIVFAYIFATIDFPILIGFSFLAIIMYAGIIGLLIVFTNAIISTIRGIKDE